MHTSMFPYIHVRRIGLVTYLALRTSPFGLRVDSPNLLAAPRCARATPFTCAADKVLRRPRGLAVSDVATRKGLPERSRGRGLTPPDCGSALGRLAVEDRAPRRPPYKKTSARWGGRTASGACPAQPYGCCAHSLWSVFLQQ